MARTRYGFSKEQFVRVWQGSATLSEVGAKLGEIHGGVVPENIIRSRATALSNAGVTLKRMQRRRAIDVEELRKLADDLLAQEEEVSVA